MPGSEIINNFVYAKEKFREKGTIYNPDDGKSYSCTMTLQKDGTLLVRGYVLIAL
jgi:uncharacterized protein (DUF2147 family)